MYYDLYYVLKADVIQKSLPDNHIPQSSHPPMLPAHWELVAHWRDWVL